MSISPNFPPSRPRLNLNFARTRQLDPRVTFSRNSNGTYVDRTGIIRTAGVNVPRFDYDPVTGVCNGLLIEESRTNLDPFSQDFTTITSATSWSIQKNNIIAPDGTLTGNILTRTSITGDTITRGFVLNNTSITFSVFLKKGTFSTRRFAIRNNTTLTNLLFVDYNFDNKSFSIPLGNSIYNVIVTNYSNDWIRLSLTVTSGITSGDAIICYYGDAGGNAPPEDVGKFFYMWGAQLEVGPSATSYIPTSGSTVTRAADTILLSGNNFSSFYNSSGGSLVASVIPNRNTSTNQNILTIGDGTTSNNINLIVSPNTSGGIYATNSGVRLNTISSGLTQSDVSFTGYTDQSLLISSNFSNSNFNLNYNSSGVGTSSSGTLPTVSQMIIGAGVSSTNRFTGTISRISYYPTSLSTSNLSSLSTASPTAAIPSTPNNNQYQFIIRVPSNNYTYTVLTLNSGTYRYNVDWGDGTSTNNITTNNPTKVYKTAGYYKINVTQNTGSFWLYNGGNATYGPNLTYITGTGSSFVWNTNFAAAWYGCSSLTSFPLIDTSNGTTFTSAWRGCFSLTSFPLIDTSKGTIFQQSWQGCSSLTSFPLINTSNGTNFNSTWYQCTNLTSFPTIDTSKGTDFTQTWASCLTLTSFPNLNFSSGTNFLATWRFSSGITSFSTGFSFGGTGATNPVFNLTWDSCTKLSSFPAGAFNACTGSTNYTSAWNGCGLTSGSIENILTSIVSSGATINTPIKGNIGLNGGTNVSFSTWTSPAITAFNTLVGAGWTISYNP